MNSKTHQVLLVDDEEALLKSTEMLLRVLGCQVTTAANGNDAISKFLDQTSLFDLVIMDLGLPDMDGQALLKEILAIKSDSKVIISSGYLGTEERKELKTNGAMGFLNKPYNRAQLTEVLNQYIKDASIHS